MANDYNNNNQRKSSSEGKSSSFLTGLLIGVLLGVAIAVVFTVYIKGGTSAFTIKNENVNDIQLAPNSENGNTKEEDTDTPPKSRFEFYDILPGQSSNGDNAKPSNQTEENQAQYSFYLQVGAFKTEQEADNMKAKMALIGLEAIVEPVSLEDKGVLHRVRVGPFVDMAQVNKAKTELKENEKQISEIPIQNLIQFRNRNRDKIRAFNIELNNSLNPTFTQTSMSVLTSSNTFVENNSLQPANVVSSSYDTEPYLEKTTFISSIKLYDDNKNVIGIAKLAKPVRKTQERDLTFKLRLDL
jgi:cell division protein FtsN